jgi:hypothetical protein
MVCQEPPVFQDLLGHLGGREIRELLEAQGHQDSWVLQEHLVGLDLMDYRDRRDCQELQDIRVAVVCQVYRERRVCQELQEDQDQHQFDIMAQ